MSAADRKKDDFDEVWGTDPERDMVDYWQERNHSSLSSARNRHRPQTVGSKEVQPDYTAATMWSAIALAIVFTGGGHFVLRRFLRGSVFLGGAVVALVAGIISFGSTMSGVFGTCTTPGYPSMPKLFGTCPLGGVALSTLVLILIHVLSVGDAIFLAITERKGNSPS